MTRRMRIAHVVHAGLPFEVGFTLRTQRIARSQSDLGLEPIVIVEPDDQPPLCQWVDANGVGLSEFDGIGYLRLSAPGAWQRLAMRLSHRLRQRGVPGSWRLGYDYYSSDTRRSRFSEILASRIRDVDIIHAHTPAKTAKWGLQLARDHGKPFVYEVRGFWDLTGEVELPDTEGEREFLRRRREGDLEVARAADAVITLGTNMKEELARRGVPEKKIMVVPNAVDWRSFPRADERDRRIVDALQLDEAFVVGYATSVRRLEGVHVVLEAYHQLKAKGGNSRFILLGDGTELENLRAMVKKLGIADVVHLLGRVPHDEVARYYSVFDAFVVPRIDAAVCRLVTPLKPLEAMAYRLPVIASDLPALRECVDDDKTGILFQPDDAASLAAAIERLSSDRRFCRQLGENASSWVRENRDLPILGELSSKAYDMAASSFAISEQ